MRPDREQTELEARLAAASLPAVTLDRDALMYRAGWEAAGAAAAHAPARWAWPAGAAAAMAASLLLGMQLARPVDPAGVAANHAQPVLAAREAAPADAPTGGQAPTPTAPPPRLPDAQRAPSPWLAWVPRAAPLPGRADPADTSLLALRERIATGDLGPLWPSNGPERGEPEPAEPPRRAATAGELMQELLAEGGVRS
ncbi:hypothetical protein Pla175_25440 [Pirellulimonas nuda]|uniref:Uncharacterized protein n=1 Tax=Pirellulimonas nuda TaxID=2528009 RepID=A0A518DCE6_9BACT|nr:hypothetical protein [Pirellulimonas nuda]QDU89157.1 hypothetical protein Pla175_25440 [Pirellulimonas nuda]